MFELQNYYWLNFQSPGDNVIKSIFKRQVHIVIINKFTVN